MPSQAITPPLAVNFKTNEESEKENKDEENKGNVNRFGKKQGFCDMRGQCWLGCRRQAKNSLDLNYLAMVEAGRLDGQPLADIRTLAEVERIEPGGDCACGKDGPRYVVHYRDRLITTTNADRDGQSNLRSCSAKNVFLCAGAIGTTEILLRSENVFGGYGTKSGKARARLGTRYFPNGDSIAAVFGSEKPHRADEGPTITSALLYRRDRKAGTER